MTSVTNHKFIYFIWEAIKVVKISWKFLTKANTYNAP